MNWTATIFWALLVVPLLVMLVIALNDLHSEASDLYDSPRGAYGTMLVTGIVGTAIAVVLFYTVSTSALSVVHQVLAETLLVGRIGVPTALLPVGVAAVGAILIATWAHQQVQADFDSP